MKIFNSSIARNPLYFFSYLIFFIVLFIYCFAISKADGFLLINHFHTRLLDDFFILFTNVGNGLFVIGLMILMLVRRKFVWTLQIGISFLISGLLVQLLKILMHNPRPSTYFGSGAIHCILGITRTGFSSFPSGHTATVFMLTTLLAIYLPGRKSTLLFISMAVLTGFSRVYLSQHFPVDVLAGSLLGVLVSLMVYQFIPLKNVKKKFPGKEWEHQSVKLR
jgi:membrane-associated phospholipid phosphatase